MDALGVMKFVGSIVICIFVYGCTELQVTHLDGSKNAPGPLNGAIYYLTVGQVDVTVIRKLSDCQKESADFDVSAEATVIYAPDLSKPLQIDYRSLNNAFKKTTISIQLYENGTLKAINAEFNDRSGAVISNIGAAGAQMAKIAAGLGTGGGTSMLKGYLETTVCNTQIRYHLENAQKIKRYIKQLWSKIIKVAVDKRAEVQAEIDKNNTILTEEEAYLTSKQKYTQLTPVFNGNTKSDDACHSAERVWAHPLNIDDAVLSSWIQEKYREKAKQSLSVCLQSELVSAQNTALANAPVIEGDATKVRKGSLVYRQPGPLFLTLCRKGNCNVPDNIISRTTQMFPQAGVQAVLPLYNGMFDNNVLKASFLPSGALVSLDYITEAQAEAASATLANLAGVAREGLETFDNAEIVKLKTRVDEIKLQNELLKLRREQDQLRIN